MKINFNRRAFAQYLSSDRKLQAELTRRAGRVSGRLPGSSVALDHTDRAVARVILTDSDALRREADTGEISAALDAGSGE